MRIRKRNRKRIRAKKLDLTDLRHVLRDKRQWTSMGVVVVPDGESSHYELLVEDGAVVDVLVDVELVPDGGDVTCRLGGAALSHGIITVPAEGDEVAVVLPAGRQDFMPIIVALLSTNAVPNPTGQGPAPGRTLILNAEVLVHDGTGTAEQLVKKSDYEALKSWADSHRHKCIQAATGGVVGVTSVPDAATTPAVPGGTADPAPTAVCTSVLKGK